VASGIPVVLHVANRFWFEIVLVLRQRFPRILVRASNPEDEAFIVDLSDQAFLGQGFSFGTHQTLSRTVFFGTKSRRPRSPLRLFRRAQTPTVTSGPSRPPFI
jgi:hypothetical protein